MKKQTIRGSVLIFILLSVALLGALTVVLSRTSSNTEETGSGERASIEASQIMSYGNSLKQTIESLITKGCSENELNFDHSTLTGYTNPNAPSNKSCNVFDIEGGAASLKYFPDTATPPTVTSGYTVTNLGTTKTELIYTYPVTKNVCSAINKTLGIPNNGTEGPPTDELDNGVKFIGTFTDAGATATEEISTAEFVQKKAGCRHQSGTGSSAVFEYFQVLLTR
jgi:hypothetical protein